MNPTKTMWAHFAQVKWQLRIAAMLGALTTISTVSLLATSGWLIARAAQMPAVLDLSIAIVGVRTFALLRSVTRYSERLISHNATFQSLPRIRIAMYRKLEQLSPSGLAQFHRGDLMSRVVADVDDIQDLPLRVYVPIASSAISSIFCIGLVTWILPLAGALFGLCLVVAALCVPIISARTGAAHQQALAHSRSTLSESLLDFHEGLTDIAMLDAGEQVLRSIDEANDAVSHIDGSFATRTGIASALVIMLQGIALCATVWASAHALHSSRINSVLVVVLGLIPLAAFESVTGLPNAFLTLHRVRGSANRLGELLDMPSPDVDRGKNDVATFNIELTDVSARWPGSSRLAISDIKCAIPEGKTTFFIGQSGSGKSSLIAVITKLLATEDGTVTVGNVDIDDISGNHLRQHVIATGHDAHVFATSIAENLRLASPHEITDNQIADALQHVELASWVASLPQGIHTVLGDNGTRMSGGQRQRLIMARMFIAHPDVWIIDEPSEHLDAQLAETILVSIRAKTMDRTLIVATHRLSDAISSDHITVLANGQVFENGQQTLLAASHGYFAKTLRNEQLAQARLANA